jgi:CRISPR-associated protein Cas6
MNYVELHFNFTGTTLPSDHGYGLYGAISRILPEAHKADWLAVETLPGVARGDGFTQLDQQARLKIRIPHDRVPVMLKLAGKSLEIDGHAIRLGAPQIFSLKPATTLYARIVTIKGFTEPVTFLDAASRQLRDLSAKGELIAGDRRVVRVGNHVIVGFSLTIHELSDKDSLILQERGIGGRRRMGCGIFIPIPGRRRNDQS